MDEKTVKCYECGNQVPVSIRYIENHITSSGSCVKRNYHPECWQEHQDKIVLQTYVCRLFGLKQLGVVNSRVINQMRDNNNLGYADVLNLIKYVYDVRGIQRQKRLYDFSNYLTEAQQYYYSLGKNINNINEANIKPIDIEPIIIKKRKKINKPKYDIDLI